jgi:hypothetical protein
MARRIISYTTITPTATGDGSNLATTTFPFFLAGGVATQQLKIHEISISGQAASTSSPTFMILSRDSQVASPSGSVSYGSGGMDAPMDNATVALTNVPVSGNAVTSTVPQRSSTAHLMNCSLNAFGGVYFWRANKWDECPTTIGVGATTGEVSLSAFTGGTTGAIGVHCIYEPL